MVRQLSPSTLKPFCWTRLATPLTLRLTFKPRHVTLSAWPHSLQYTLLLRCLSATSSLVLCAILRRFIPVVRETHTIVSDHSTDNTSCKRTRPLSDSPRLNHHRLSESVLSPGFTLFLSVGCWYSNIRAGDQGEIHGAARWEKQSFQRVPSIILVLSDHELPLHDEYEARRKAQLCYVKVRM